MGNKFRCFTKVKVVTYYYQNIKGRLTQGIIIALLQTSYKKHDTLNKKGKN
jgi:hypothetical protein